MPKIIIDTNEVYSVPDAAKILGWGEATAWRRIKDGTLIAIKFSGRTYVPQTEIARIQKQEQSKKQ